METARYRIAKYVMHHQWASLLIIFAITAFFAVGALNTQLKTIFSDLLPKNHPFVETYLDHPNFGNPLTVSVMVKRTDGKDIYNPETLQKVWDMTRNIDLTPGVDHDQILSISTEKARYAQATPFGIDSQPLMGDRAPQTPEEMEEFIDRVKKSPGSQNFLISPDGTATLIQATFIERLMDYGEVFQFVQDNIVKAEADDVHEIYAAGQPMLTGWVYFYEKQMLVIFTVTGVALLLSLVLYMRNVVGVVVPLVSSLVAAVWGFGFVGWLGDPIEPLIMVVPLLLVARSFSHCVQFIERFYEIQYHVQDKKKAAEISMSVMMAPGTLGIVTDAVGLFLIAIAPIPTMERFAVFCGFWALMLVPSGVFLTPLMLSMMPEPKNVKKIIGADEEAGGLHVGIKHMLQRVSRVSYGGPAKITTVVVVVLFAFSLFKMFQIKIGNPVEGSNLLWSDSDYNVAVSQINDHFPGLNTLEIIFEVKEEEQERLLKQADTIFKMTALQRLVESDESPPVATLSFADYLPEANRLFSGGNPKWAPLDNNDQAVSAAGGAVLFGSSPKAFSHVTDFVQQNGTVSLWYKDNKQETVDVALEQVRSALDEIGIDHEKFKIRLGSGTIALQQSINDTVDLYQYYILAALNVVILITCSWAYRSIVAGFLLLIPVNMANCFLAAVMVYMGIGLDVNTLPIAAIGIGVGIDYGIYLLSRICEEFQEHKDYGLAILSSVATTGKAIFFTATIVLIGILPWYFMSELKFLADMGLLLVMVMLINMVIALVVVPLLVWLMKPKFVASEDLLVGEGVNLADYTGGDEAFQ
ncbi:MAG TPA: RND transporter [Porticoccaceae bacterium]|nr:RND transporter [Porticoccaceae bacterium]